MNTDKLSKLYDTLTPAERVPLIFGARQREDATEVGRLVRAAPREIISRPDFYGLERQLELVSYRYFTRQLSYLCQFNQVLASMNGVKEDEKIPVVGKVIAYLFTVNAKGWEAFCVKAGLDPTYLADGIDGSDIVRDHAPIMEAMACDHAAATEFYGDAGPAPTPEEIAEELCRTIILLPS